MERLVPVDIETTKIKFYTVSTEDVVVSKLCAARDKDKMIGKIISKNGHYLIVFDLNSTEMFRHATRDEGTNKPSRNPIFPAEWKNQFGLPVEEHKKLLQVNIFDI